MADGPPGDDMTTTSGTNQERNCPVCQTPFVRVRRQQYCSESCRKTAWTRRHPRKVQTPQPIPPPPGRRRDVTVYSCPECDTRYYGQQWCHDCNKPCTRLGLGGLCPHCDEPVTVTDLFNPEAILD